MSFGVIHLVSNVQPINFGIWNAALFGSHYLREKYGINSCLVVCSKKATIPESIAFPVLWWQSIEKLLHELNEIGFTPSESVVVSHGCWQMPTRLGHRLQKQGFKWIYTPHGMLEPWSLSNHRLKKMVYFHLFESRFFKLADAVRAVSETEKANLQKLMKNTVRVIENGVVLPSLTTKVQTNLQFLFMARLHFKKGILPLVRAWSNCMPDTNAQLTIAGPDEGELDKIRPYLNEKVKYVGPVYGEAKEKLLEQSHYYLLPSYSEGFPTSVVEAMSYGLVPLISRGCNFPEVFQNNLGYLIEPNEESILTQLISLKRKPFDDRLSKQNHQFIKENYSDGAIGEKLKEMYAQLVKEKV